MKLKIRYVFLWTLCVFLTLGVPVQVIVKGLSSLITTSDKSVEDVPSVSISSHDKRLKGTFNFSRKRTFVVGSNSLHLQGHVKIRGQKYPAGASKVGNVLTVSYPSRIVNRRQRMNTLKVDVSSNMAHIKSVPMSISQNTECGSENEEHVNSKTVLPMNEGLPAKTALFATLHTYADQEFYAKYGSATNERILSIVNAAEAIYGEQLGVRFRIVGQTILSTSDGVYDPSKILSNFRNDATTQNNEVDLKHLFTGKDMTGVTVGIAYIGALCYSPDYSYGVTQDYYSLESLIFAHELGHNFGASHSSAYNTIMYPAISPYATHFSDDSLNLINSHINNFGSCLSIDSYGPNLSQAKLSIKRMSRMIYGRLLDSGGNPIVGEIVVLSVNGRKVQYTTDTNGSYRHFLRASKKKKRYVVVASTEHGEKLSRVLKFTV